MVPKSNTEFWQNKIAANIARDDEKIAQLLRMNWKVITVWECELKPTQRSGTLTRLVQQIREQAER